MMYNGEYRSLTICRRTDGFCTETLDCEQFKTVNHMGDAVCPHKEGREIRMPKKKDGYF